jgi:hypothetical protein
MEEVKMCSREIAKVDLDEIRFAETV